MTTPTTPPADLLPLPAFRLTWREGAYYVSEPNIGNADCYTAEQFAHALAPVVAERAQLQATLDRAYELKRAAEAERDALRSQLASMVERVEALQEYQPRVQKCRPAKSGFVATMVKKARTCEGDEYGYVHLGAVVQTIRAALATAPKEPT